MTIRSMSLILMVALVFAAYGDDDSTPTTATTTAVTAMTVATTTAPTTTAAPATAPPTAATTTAAPITTAAAALPTTRLQAQILDGYKFGAEGGVAGDEDLPFVLGSITADVFSANGFYVIVYEGLDLEATGPLCPGNSIATASGFEFVSNSPTPGATCVGAPTVLDGIMVCSGLVSYMTPIPSDLAGSLFASVEIYTGTGTNLGASGGVEVAGDAPEIDLGLLDC